MKINIPKYTAPKITKIKLDLDILKNKIYELVDKLENQGFLDLELYNFIVEMKVNKEELDRMISDLNNFCYNNPQEAAKDGVNFDWAPWVEKLSTKHIY